MKKENLSSALKLIREYYGLTQTNAAIKIGISRVYLNEVEHGKRPLLKTIEKISAAYNMPISALFLIAEQCEESEPVLNNIKAKLVLKWSRDRFLV